MARQTPERPAAARASRGCQLSDLFGLLGKTHMLDILHYCIERAEGPVRFVTLQKSLRLSPNTLSERLRQLVDAGLLTRTYYDEIPPRVDYDVTKKALELRTVFQRLIDWSQKHDLGPASG